MNYLSPSEYENYGLEATTAPAWVAAASSLVEAHCRRPTLAVTQYTERLRITAGRNSVRLTYLPLAAVAPAVSPLVSARGRYGSPRRSEAPMASALDARFAQNVALAFSLPGTWTSFDTSTVDFCADTGELTLPSNALGLEFNEIEVTYTAGCATVPEAVKTACAQMVRNALATPALNVRAGTLDRMHLEYFADTLLDATVCALLAPYVAQKVA